MLLALEGWVWDTEEPILSLLKLPLGQGMGVGRMPRRKPPLSENNLWRKEYLSLTLTETGSSGTCVDRWARQVQLEEGKAIVETSLVLSEAERMKV